MELMELMESSRGRMLLFGGAGPDAKVNACYKECEIVC